MESVTRPCRQCGVGMTFEPLFVAGREFMAERVCESCQEILLAEQAAKVSADAATRRQAAWLKVCPALYRDTDIARIPATVRRLIDGWRYGPRGLGLCGSAGLCKTRAAFEILRRQHEAGRFVFAVSSMALARAAVDQFSDDREAKSRALSVLDRAKRCEVLLIDDLGKGRLTERAEAEFFDILETRTATMAPTIWTANTTDGNQLAAMLSDDRRDPIMRRLVEFSEIPRLS